MMGSVVSCSSQPISRIISLGPFYDKVIIKIITTINRTESIILLMPITMDEFQQGNIIDGSSKIVLDYLRSHRD
jgi:hypothetical protein